MNLRISGDRSFHVEVTFEFYKVRKLWSTFLEIKDKVDVLTLNGNVHAHVDFTVVGRHCHEIKQITLEYDGHMVILDPGDDKFENLSPIVLYDGGRDFWTNQLRRKALKSK